jgi:adenosine kinase
MFVAFCNPLIDATVIRDEAFLKQWNLKNDDAILADAHYQPLVDEVVKDPKAFMTGGGSGQNTLVMAQWMLQEPNRTTIVGAVGDDANAATLQSILTKSGVKCQYQVLKGDFTGCGVVIVVGSNRSIVASVAASGRFNYTDWNAAKGFQTIQSAALVLISGYFLRSCDRTGLTVSLECQRRNIPIALGLASPTVVVSEAWPALSAIFRAARIVFGNQSEILILGQQLGVVEQSATEQTVDYSKLVSGIANIETVPGQTKRLVVMTCGADPTVACETGSTPIVRPVLPIAESEIVDTNGAGDSFAGGFLAWFLRGESLEKCIDAGSYSAAANLKERGLTVPSYPPSFS